MNIKEKLNEYLKFYLKEFEENKPLKGFMKKQIFKERAMYEEEACYEDRSIEEFINSNKEDSFQTKLFNYIDKKGVKDSDVYNKVNLDRRLFSKIRSNEKYHPSKETVILLGIALELSELEIEDLLKSASYYLSMNTEFDLIIRFCFKEGIYNLNQINEFLYDYDCKLLNQ